MNFRKRYLPYFIVFASVLILVFYLSRNFDQIRNLFQLSLPNLIFIIFLVLLTLLENGLINFLIYQKLEIPVNFFLGIALAVINSLANQLPLSGGLIAKGVYLKNRYQLPYSKYLSATMALFVAFLATNGFVGLIVLNGLGIITGSNSPLILNIGFGLMVLALLLLWIPIPINWIPLKFYDSVKNIEEGWHLLRKDKLLLGGLIGIQLFAILTLSLRYWMVFQLFSQNINIFHCLLFSSATILTSMAGIIPGGIGVREGIVAFMASSYGFNPGVTALAVGMDRLISLVIILILGGTISYWLSQDVIMRTEN